MSDIYRPRHAVVTTSLEKQLAAMTQERNKWASLKESLAITALERDSALEQLAAMTQERDELVKVMVKGLDSELVKTERRLRYEVIEQLAAMTQERDELVAIIKEKKK